MKNIYEANIWIYWLYTTQCASYSACLEVYTDIIIISTTKSFINNYNGKYQTCLISEVNN